MENTLWMGLTYDDVLLVPMRSNVTSRKQVSTVTKFSRNLELQIPIVASNMDTVCEASMAISMARNGGLGILHRFASVEEQCNMVKQVKRAQSFLIEDPRTIAPDEPMAEVLAGLSWPGRKGGVRSLMVVHPTTRKFMGIITRADVQFASPGASVGQVMTPVEKVVTTTNVHIRIEEAREIMRANRIHDLPVIDATGALKYLITSGDLVKLASNSVATLDNKRRLKVGAAVGVKAGDQERARALVAAGCDVLVIDIAHGHSDFCINMLKKLKADPLTNTVDIVAGNIATGAAAKDLIEAGADGLKVGVGPGSICITRLVAGAGVPQLSALIDINKVARAAGVPIIADGGVKTAGDIGKACAAGADTVMLGNMLAGTDEAPGRVLVKDGKKVKIIRGMAGYGANISKAEREKNADDDVFLDMVPEGVEGNVPYKGPVTPILRQLVGGLRSGISYCGGRNLKEMRENHRFVRMSPSGLRESGSHDISKL